MLKKVEISILTVLFIFVFYCALTIGISWDLEMEITRGNERLKYILFQNSFENYYTATKHIGGQYYPAFYTTFASFVAHMFPKKYEFEIWQLTNSLFSILTVFGIYRVSSHLFNKKVGKIVFLLYFLNPIFFGHMAMNPKDTIVAFAHVWSTYVFLRYLKNQNRKDKCNRHILLGGLAIGVGTGMRLPFLITLIPLFFFAIIDILFFKKIICKEFSLQKFIIHLIVILLIAYLVTISCWPYAHKNIITEPFKLALLLKNLEIPFGIPWGLINGHIFYTIQPPNLYIIANFFYKSPEFILLCYVIFIYFVIANKKFFLSQFDFFWGKILLILFIFLFPTIFLIFSPYRAYDGLRLFLYLIPYFNIIPGLAIYYLIYNFNSLMPKLILGAIGSLFVYFLFIFILLTPYQYTYLNLFVGNFSNAHKKFENDYWAISIKELVKKIPKETNLISNNTEIKITFCGAPNNLVKIELKKLKNLKFEQGGKYYDYKNFDYVIMTNRIFVDVDKAYIDAQITGQDTLAELIGDNLPENVTTCFDVFKGEDLITVERNGLMLSTLRKKL